MRKRTIMIADNTPDTIDTLKSTLEREGYEVIVAATPDEAIQTLRTNSTIDLAVLDQRLVNESDPLDYSGIRVANESPQHIPKIIFTAFPTAEAARAALSPRVDAPPVTVDYLSKIDGLPPLLLSINRTLWHKARGELEAQQAMMDVVRIQARVFFWISVMAAVIGIILFFISLVMILSGQAATSLPGILGAALIEVVGILIYQRVDRANARLDSYFKDQQFSQYLNDLMDQCDKLTGEAREECISKVNQAAQERLFKQPHHAPTS
jgi:CheY-like chemotaxis protein